MSLPIAVAYLGKSAYELRENPGGIFEILRKGGDGKEAHFYVPKALFTHFLAATISRVVTNVVFGDGEDSLATFDPEAKK